MGAILVNPVPNRKDGRPVFVTSTYGPRSGGMYSMHRGVDMLFEKVDGEPKGMPYSEGKWTFPDLRSGEAIPAVAAGDGLVTFSAWTGTGYGMHIDHGNGWLTKYMHMRDIRGDAPKKGARVRAGQPLAMISFNPWKSGAPRATPTEPRKIGLNHLHWELWKNGQSLDPEAYFGRHLEKLRKIDNPWESSFLINVALATGAGYLLYKYVFV